MKRSAPVVQAGGPLGRRFVLGSENVLESSGQNFEDQPQVAAPEQSTSTVTVSRRDLEDALQQLKRSVGMCSKLISAEPHDSHVAAATVEPSCSFDWTLQLFPSAEVEDTASSLMQQAADLKTSLGVNDVLLCQKLFNSLSDFDSQMFLLDSRLLDELLLLIPAITKQASADMEAFKAARVHYETELTREELEHITSLAKMLEDLEKEMPYLLYVSARLDTVLPLHLAGERNVLQLQRVCDATRATDRKLDQLKRACESLKESTKANGEVLQRSIAEFRRRMEVQR